MTAFDLTVICMVIVATNGAGWLALRTEIRWLRRDVDLAHERIDRLQRGGN